MLLTGRVTLLECTGLYEGERTRWDGILVGLLGQGATGESMKAITANNSISAEPEPQAADYEEVV